MAVVGDWAEAERHLAATAARLSAMGARPWQAVAQQSLAVVLAARGRAFDRRWTPLLHDEAAVLTGRPRSLP